MVAPTAAAVEMEPSERLTCPSSRGVSGAKLIAVLGDDARVHPILPPLEIGPEFIARAERHGPLEARFRFAGPCVESGCRQWTGSCCGVIARVMAAVEGDEALAREPLPRCGIRGTCRWYAEHGAAACRPCSYVVTDPTGHGPPAV